MLLWEVYLYHISTFTYTSVHIHLYITTFDLSLGKLCMCIQYTSYGIFAHTFKLYIPFCVLTEKSHLMIDNKA